MILEHVGRLQVLMIDHVVLTHERERRLVMKILPLTSYFLMRLGEQYHCLAPAMTPFLAARDTTLRGLERAFRLAIPARREDARAIGERSERLDAEVDPGFLSRGRQRPHWYLC